jgi:hypothetical protein
VLPLFKFTFQALAAEFSVSDQKLLEGKLLAVDLQRYYFPSLAGRVGKLVLIPLLGQQQ